ncbi:MAG: phosphoglycerate mutase family protein [Bacteroidota bacterium]
MRRLIFLVLPICLLISSCDTLRKTTKEEMGDEAVATFILVRHAEKQIGMKPALTEDGKQRAERLAFMLERVDLDAVYSSPTKRTEMTATPTAASHNLRIINYDPSLLQEFAKDLKRLYHGKTVLVVGHSNTTPALANYLAETDEYPRFSELDYTNLYVVTIPRIGKPRVVKMRY